LISNDSTLRPFNGLPHCLKYRTSPGLWQWNYSRMHAIVMN